MKKHLSLIAALLAVLCVLFCMTAVSVFADEETGAEGGETTEGGDDTGINTPEEDEDGEETVEPCEKHTFDNDCDAECNVCGTTRTATHKYDNACDTECNVCKATRETTHKYDNNCDTECNVCKTTRTVPHSYDNECDTACNICSKTRTVTHKYDNDDDKDCNTCGATRTVKTAFQKWKGTTSYKVSGYIVAGVIFVAGLVGVFFWIPKDKDTKKKSK